jgi:hypothetical protein
LPSITHQPAGETVNASQTVTLSVVATGNPPPVFRWQRNGTNLSDGGRVSGATTSNLTLANVQVVDAGSYSVVVSNLAGIANSSNAVLNVN